MDIRNNTTLGTIDSTPIVQLSNLKTDNFRKYYDATPFVGEPETELTEANYCPLPEYCLIADKHLYLAGLL